MAQGLWWLPLASEAGAVGPLPGTSGALADAAGDGGAELLRAAAAQRMNTETRRAVFCVVMGAQDCADASERLLRLPLKVCSSLHCTEILLSERSRCHLGGQEVLSGADV